MELGLTWAAPKFWPELLNWKREKSSVPPRKRPCPRLKTVRIRIKTATTTRKTTWPDASGTWVPSLRRDGDDWVDLATSLAHQYGQIRVQRASDRRALSAIYIKVYARKRGGAVAFYKDGYTDLRGWFDYASLSTTELDAVERFAILVCSDRDGAAILEAGPPAR